MALINETTNGRLCYCERCRLYHLEFGNMFFKLTESELANFKAYVEGIDGIYYTHLNRHAGNNRKILLQTASKTLLFCVNAIELEELKSLVLGKQEFDNMCQIHLLTRAVSMN